MAFDGFYPAVNGEVNLQSHHFGASGHGLSASGSELRSCSGLCGHLQGTVGREVKIAIGLQGDSNDAG